MRSLLRILIEQIMLLGVGKYAEVYSAVIPSLREALSILERATMILGEKDLGEEIKKIHKRVGEVISLLNTKPRPTNLVDTLRQLRSELKLLSESGESVSHHYNRALTRRFPSDLKLLV